MKHLITLLLPLLAAAQFTFDDVTFMAQATRQAATSPPSFSLPQSERLVLWMAASDLSASDGTTIGTWVDKSGGGNHFTNPATANQPFITNNVINGLPALRFHSAARWLQNSNSFLSGARTAEVFTVVRPISTANAASMWAFAEVGVSGNAAHPFSDLKLYEHFGAKSSRPAMLITNISNPFQWHVWNVAVRTNFMLCRFDGNIVGGNDVVHAAFTNHHRLGRSFGGTDYWDGEMAEIIIYNTVLTDAQRAEVTDWLAAKYGLAVTNAQDTYTPADFPGIAGWWRASNIGSNHNEAVRWWPDLSGNGQHLTNSGSISQIPLYQEAAFNGEPAVSWSGNGGSNRLFMQRMVHFTNAMTAIFIVSNNANTRVLASATTGNMQWRHREGGNNRYLLFNGSTTTSDSFPRAVGEPHMAVWQRLTNGAPRFWQNATNWDGSAHSGTLSLDAVGYCPPCGTANTLDGMLAEVVLYTNALSFDAITKLYYTYFRPRYALP
jgi:hypothetical protein